MDKLLILNFALILVISVALWLCKRFVRSRRGGNILLLCAAVVTVLCHYSTLLYHLFTGGPAMEHLRDTPNLILPIYPCNVVMWCCVIFGFCRQKQSRFCRFLADYIFWFGILSTLVGMFANVDFIMNPTLADWSVTKSILAHATMLFNVLLLPVYGHIRIDLPKNWLHILISEGVMLAIGAYCNLIFQVLVSDAMAYQVNSMFLIHSPFAGIPYLTYPLIAGMALVLYGLLFWICELFAYKKGNRFYNRLKKK